MTDRLDIAVDDDSLLQYLQGAVDRLESPAELFQKIGDRLVANVQRRFITKLDPSGTPWEPLAESTLEAKAGKGSILELSGIMKSTLARNVDANAVEVGFSQFYAGYHETGSKDGRLPRRGMLLGAIDYGAGTGELGVKDALDVLAVVERYLAESGR
jgi:phage gpG-like protein